MKIQADLQQLLQSNVRLEAILGLERSVFWSEKKNRGKQVRLLETAEMIFLITGSKKKHSNKKAMETNLFH